jgi:hypothetical protein
MMILTPYFNLFVEGVRYINLINDNKETVTAADLTTLSATLLYLCFRIGRRNYCVALTN